MAGDGRDHALSEQEIQNLRALAKRLLMETDPGKLQILIEQLRRIVEKTRELRSRRPKPRRSLFAVRRRIFFGLFPHRAWQSVAESIPPSSEGPFPVELGAPVRATLHLWLRHRLLSRLPFQFPFLRIECRRMRDLPEGLTVGS